MNIKALVNKICLVLIMIIAILFIDTTAFAETKTFIKEYTYQASEFDSKASSRTIALEQVKRLLLEELGTYLENNTEVKNFELTKDKITALTAGVVQAKVLDEKWDGKSYWLKAEIKADPTNVAKSLDVLRKDQKKSEDLEDIKRRQDNALNEIKELKSEIARLKNDRNAQENFNKYVGTLKTENYATLQKNCMDRQRQRTSALVAEDWESLLQLSTDYIAICRGIRNNDYIADVYSDIAIAHYEMGNFKQAVTASNKGIETSYEVPDSHLNRGRSLIALGNLSDGYKSLNIAEKLAKQLIEWAKRDIYRLEITKNEANTQLDKEGYELIIIKYESILNKIEWIRKNQRLRKQKN